MFERVHMAHMDLPVVPNWRPVLRMAPHPVAPRLFEIGDGLLCSDSHGRLPLAKIQRVRSQSWSPLVDDGGYWTMGDRIYTAMVRAVYVFFFI